MKKKRRIGIGWLEEHGENRRGKRVSEWRRWNFKFHHFSMRVAKRNTNLNILCKNLISWSKRIGKLDAMPCINLIRADVLCTLLASLSG